MKKIGIIVGSIACLIAMNKPKTEVPTKVINNYFIKSGCGGNCHCKH